MQISPDDLALYHYESCPYCLKVREALNQLDLDIEYRNTRENKQYREELKAGGGKNQVPCLRIETPDRSRWMYESDDIVNFLVTTFAES